MRGLAALVIALLVAASPAAALDISGRYQVKGATPDNSSYTGTAEVTKTGETYRVTWSIGGTKYVGTGIGKDGFIAVAYKAGGSDTGICLLVTEDGDRVNVVWTYAGGRTLGGEQWTR
ncbi:hypothetical protein [Methylobacterium sp. JK268]